MPAIASSLATYRRLLSYLKPYWWALLLVVVGFALNAGTEVGVARLMQYIIDAINQHNRERMNLFPVLIVGLFAVRGLATFLGNYYSALMARQLVYRLRIQVFERLLTLPAAFFMQNASGHLSSKLIFDVEQVTSAATEALKTVIRDGLVVVSLLGYLFYSNWRLSLTLVVVIPLIGVLVRQASRRFKLLSRSVQDSMGEVSHIVTEVINGYSVVKSYGGQATEFERFRRASWQNLQDGLKIVITNSINTPLVQLLMASAMAVVVWLALRPEILGGVTAGQFIAFIGAAGLLSKPVRSLTEVNEKIQRGLTAAESVFALIDAPPEPDFGTLTPVLMGALTFQKVSLRYDEGSPALKNIYLDIKAGETVALVGRSGAGKTSLVNLLLRLNEPTTGQILADGIPLPDIKLQHLRAHIASVGQQVILFDGTVRDNIAYGQLGHASDLAVKQAAISAYADDFIQHLPEQYNTMIGPNGLSLSGGQRQRLAIARALLKQAPILVLDEATSALDNESEHFIQQALSQAMQQRTTVVIAHRLSTIEQADRIVVMDGGRIVEVGSHTELLAKNGLYTQLHNRQFSTD